MTGWKEVMSREAERWLAGRNIKKKKKKSGSVFLQYAKFRMTCWILIQKKEVSSAQEIVWLYICSLKTLPNIVLQVA